MKKLGRVQLVGQDGNALAILGRCQRAAKEAGVDNEEIAKFREKAMSSDYGHLLRTVMEHFEIDEEWDEDE